MSPFPLALAAALLAHNPDTSYLRVTISADKIETRLTYDIFTLLKITPLDDNQDNKLQRSELENHAPQIADYLQSKIGFAISEDDEEGLGRFRGFLWPPDVGDAIPAADFHTQNGLIPFDFVRPIEFVPEEVAIYFNFFDRFTDRHTVLGVFKYEQHEFETTLNAYTPDFDYPTGMETPLWHRLRKFFVMGVEHIFLGYDHICFLIALIVVSRFREIIKIVTSFTIAHSITLILATLEVISLPSRLIETSIALTILYVALENIWLLLRPTIPLSLDPSVSLSPSSRAPSPESRAPSPLPRWLLTFLFGLIHGFGFANVLQELPATGKMACLLIFNLGVEFGQLAIALCLLPLAYLLHHWKYGRHLAIAISALLALFGLAWFIDRAFNLELMQRLGL
jgi:hydrogenase/urease accessory protein HupE